MIRNLKGIMLAVWLSSGVGVRVGLAVDESAKSDERIGLTNMVASNTYAGTRAENIGDGSLVSAWNAGDYAPQSVEFELEKKKNIITKMRLVPGQSPAGRTAHEVYAADSTGTYRMVARIEEYTSDGVPLVQEFLPPLHNVSKMMVKSVSSPSWIAWQEIEVYGIGGSFSKYDYLAKCNELKIAKARELAKERAKERAKEIQRAKEAAIREKNKNVYKYSYGDRVIPHHDGKNYWEGVVVDRADGRYKVKITHVELGGWFALGIRADSCTGNERLDYSSKGTYIWIPKSCVE